MAQTALIQVHIDADVKRRADELFSCLGFDTPTAIRIFLNQSIQREGIPFEVAIPQPNAETLAATLESVERIPRRYGGFMEIVDEIQQEIDSEEADETRD
jgi:DNA-damage-inducible protein J